MAPPSFANGPDSSADDPEVGIGLTEAQGDLARKDQDESSANSRAVDSMERFLGLVAARATLPVVASVPAIPGYEVMELLGHGGMGVVYKARHLRLNRLVAIKMIMNGVYARPGDQIRFLSEAEAVARLQHPNIIQIYEVDEYDCRPYLALEYVDGGNLHQRLCGVRLSALKAAELIESLALAVHAAHERGVIHSDLKPANILLTPDGRAKIADFGLARHPSSPPSISRSDEILGTPSYMAPEQVHAKFGRVGPAADIYALGAIFYEILTGRPPFRGISPIDTLRAVVSEEPVSPRRLNPKIPRDLATICLKALSKEPASRYATASDLARDVQRFFRNEPIRARHVGPAERLWRWCRRNPVVATVLLILVFTSGVAVVALDRAQRHAVQEQRQRYWAERQLSENYLDRGLSLCDQGHESLGLLWMTRALRHLPPGSKDLEYAIRANLSMWQAQLFPLEAILQHAPYHTVTTRKAADRARRGGGVEAVAITPDGRFALTGGMDGHARLWEIRTGRQLWVKEQFDPVFAVAFSPDGSIAVTGGRFEAQLWDVLTGTAKGKPLRHDGPVFAVSFSPDGRRMVVGGRARGKGGWARLWDLVTFTPIGRPLEHTLPVRSVAFSPDARSVLTGSDDGHVRFWDAETVAPSGQVLAHGAAVLSIAFRQDGNVLATGSEDGAVRLWKSTSGMPIGSILHHRNEVVAVAFAPDGNTLLTGSTDQTCRVWDLVSGRTKGGAMQHRGKVRALALSRDGCQIVTGCSDGTARVWRIDSSKQKEHSWKHAEPVIAICVSPDGNSALIAYRDCSAVLWNLVKGESIGAPLVHPGICNVVAFSPDSSVALTCAGNVMSLWETATGRLQDQAAHESPVYAACFRDDAKTLVVIDEEGKVSNRTVDGTPIGKPFSVSAALTAGAFSPDGNFVLIACEGGHAQVWETRTGQRVGSSIALSAAIDSAAFSVDGKRIALGCRDGTAGMWDIATGKMIGVTLQHDRMVAAVACCNDNRVVMTGSDRVMSLWAIDTGKRIGKPSFQGKVSAVAFSSTGLVLTGSDDKTVRLSAMLEPFGGPPDSIALGLSVVTGMELDNLGVVRSLSANEWEQRRRSKFTVSIRPSVMTAGIEAAPTPLHKR